MLKRAAAFLWRRKIFLATFVLGGFIAYSLSTYQKPALLEPDTVIAADVADESADTGSDVTDGVFDLEDGTYQGTGTGYGGSITVEVTIKDGKIESINIVSAPGEGASFLERAKAVIDAMVKNQSMDVDTVSGATYSSRGIIEAVKNVLTGEVSTSAPAAGGTASKGSAGSVGTVDEDENYKDGIYTGSAQGFGGTIKVEVTIKNGKIKTIKVLSASGETTSYFNRAKRLLNTIISKQSTNVDAVSGATYSSNGLIKAVRNALAKAVDSDSKSDSKEDASPAKTGTLPYADGVYYGTGEGYAGDITVALLIRDKTLRAAVITDTVDGDSYIARAESILDSVVKKQSAKVDVVSGATYSSKGIIRAVKNALKAAASGKTGLDAIDNPNQNTGGNSTNTEPSESEEGTLYNNGTYTGSARCTDEDEFDYTLDVEITVEKDKITDVTVVDKTNTDREWKDNLFYINKAKKSLPVQITAKGNLEGIDAVSGATYSSNALLEACKAALEKAKK